MGPIYRNPPYVVGPPLLLTKGHNSERVDWGLKIHGIPEYWKNGQGEDILVGVADTGRPNHHDLEAGIDYSRNFSSSYTDRDLDGHGTHVCGILGARRNAQGVVGVAPECRLAVAKVLGDDGSGESLEIARGIEWLAEQGCQIINLSLGGEYDATLAKTIRKIVNAGVFVICAAGNEGSSQTKSMVGYPAKLPETIAVASYNKRGRISRFSSRGPEVTMAFPGEDITSTWGENEYRSLSGTSMATPYCSGLVALLLATHAKVAASGETVKTPVRNNQELIEHLQRVAVDKGPAGHDVDWGWGVVDPRRFFDHTLATESPRKAATTDKSDSGFPQVWHPEFTQVGSFDVREVLYHGRNGVFVTPTAAEKAP